MPALTDRAEIALPRDASRRATRLLMLGGYAAALVMLAWPVAQVANPMLTDYPNHLARQFVAGSLPENAPLAQHYVARHDFYPYLPMDLIVGALRPLIGLEAAGKVSLVIALLMPIAGTMALARVLHGRIGLWPLASTLFAYNLMLAWGFTTYLFSIGLGLCVFAGWIATDRWSWPTRLALFAAASIVLFCSHPFAFAAYGLLLGSWEIGRTGGWTRPALLAMARRLGLAALQSVPPLMIALSLPHVDIGNDATLYGTLASRLLGLFSPFLFAVDLGEAVCIVMMLAAFVVALRSGAATFDRRLAWPVGVFGLVSLVMPQTLSGIYLVHFRPPLLFVLLLILACRPQPQAPRTVPLGIAAILTILMLRTSIAADRLSEADRNVAELRTAASAIAPGARVLPTMSQDRFGSLPAYHYWHAAAYLTIDRSAYSPLLFSYFSIDVVPSLKAASAPATSPVRFEALLTQEGEPERVNPGPGQIRYWNAWRRVFDYVVDFDSGIAPAGIPPELSVVHRGRTFTIYKIAK